jgi:hypothetical protein
MPLLPLRFCPRRHTTASTWPGVTSGSHELREREDPGAKERDRMSKRKFKKLACRRQKVGEEGESGKERRI